MPVDTFCLHWVSLLRFSPLILPDAHSPLVFSSWPSLGVFLRVFLPCFLWGLPAMPPLGAGVPQGPMLNLQLSPLAHLDPFSSLGDSPACFCLQTCISRASDLLLSPRFVCSAACWQFYLDSLRNIRISMLNTELIFTCFHSCILSLCPFPYPN